MGAAVKRWLLNDWSAPWIVGGAVFVAGHVLAFLAVLIWGSG